MTNATIIDESGGTYRSLENLENVLEDLALEKARGDPISVYELRDYEQGPGSTLIGFYLSSPNQTGIIQHNFRVHGQKDYTQVESYEGGTGVFGYRHAIALIYRYLNHQPRNIVRLSARTLRENLFDTRFWRENIDSFVERRVSESPEVNKRLLHDLEFPLPKTDFSFIVLDVESSMERETFRKYLCGCTWDFYNGMRVWEEGGINGENLVRACQEYDRVVSFNGVDFDIGQILMPFASATAIDSMKQKSIDLFKIISNARTKTEGRGKKGELKLASLAFATLGDCKYEVDCDLGRGNKTKGYGSKVVNHCARDVEMTRDLFFHMLGEHKVYHVTHEAMEKGRVLEAIDVYPELLEIFS